MTTEETTPGAVPLDGRVMPHTSAGGTAHGYEVEARVDGPPRQLGKYLLDEKWRAIQFEPSATGVPSQSSAEPWLSYCGLMRYEAAQALRWWLMAEAVWGVQTRLVKHCVQYNMKQIKGEPEDEQGDQFSRTRARAA
jgi:hypothetical protein